MRAIHLVPGAAGTLAILGPVTQPPADRLPPSAPAMSRRRFLALTDALIDQGELLVADPDWNRFRMWLLNSDELLERVWGRMDRYHLAWLNVGRDAAPPGSALDAEGTRRFIAEVARAKIAVLRTMRTSVERQGWRRLHDDDDEPDDEEQR